MDRGEWGTGEGWGRLDRVGSFSFTEGCLGLGRVGRGGGFGLDWFSFGVSLILWGTSVQFGVGIDPMPGPGYHPISGASSHIPPLRRVMGFFMLVRQWPAN